MMVLNAKMFWTAIVCLREQRGLSGDSAIHKNFHRANSKPVVAGAMSFRIAADVGQELRQFSADDIQPRPEHCANDRHS